MPEVIQIFPVDTAEAPKVSVVDGVRYVPFTAVRITPELAAKRREYNMRHPGFWSPRSCRPGFIVTYRPENSLSVSALGSL